MGPKECHGYGRERWEKRMTPLRGPMRPSTSLTYKVLQMAQTPRDDCYPSCLPRTAAAENRHTRFPQRRLSVSQSAAVFCRGNTKRPKYSCRAARTRLILHIRLTLSVINSVIKHVSVGLECASYDGEKGPAPPRVRKYLK
jgi:hypothetical protein